jgi:dTDP-4-dehydrorhamnose reductase
MKLFITGAGGQVGRELVLLAQEKSVDYKAFSRAELDITNADAVMVALKEEQPSIVINAAAYTAVDKAEDDSECAYQINSDAVLHLAKACDKYQTPLLHISTDYVFKGDGHYPYDELARVAPTGVYGASKLAGEQELMSHCQRYIILRTSWVFGQFGHNFVKTMLRLADSKSELSVVDDQQGKPTSARDIAKALVHIADSIEKGCKAWGIYHFAGDEAVTWCGFARTIFELAGKEVKVNSVTTADYPTKAERPAYSVLDTKKIQETFSIDAPSWKASLSEVIMKLENEQ